LAVARYALTIGNIASGRVSIGGGGYSQ